MHKNVSSIPASKPQPLNLVDADYSRLEGRVLAHGKFSAKSPQVQQIPRAGVTTGRIPSRRTLLAHTQYKPRSCVTTISTSEWWDAMVTLGLAREQARLDGRPLAKQLRRTSKAIARRYKCQIVRGILTKLSSRKDVVEVYQQFVHDIEVTTEYEI